MNKAVERHRCLTLASGKHIPSPATCTYITHMNIHTQCNHTHMGTPALRTAHMYLQSGVHTYTHIHTQCNHTPMYTPALRSTLIHTQCNHTHTCIHLHSGAHTCTHLHSGAHTYIHIHTQCNHTPMYTPTLRTAHIYIPNACTHLHSGVHSYTHVHTFTQEYTHTHTSHPKQSQTHAHECTHKGTYTCIPHTHTNTHFKIILIPSPSSHEH